MSVFIIVRIKNMLYNLVNFKKSNIIKKVRKESKEMRNFPIAFVVEQDLPDTKKFKTVTGFEIDCPFCGKHRKMDINLAKNLARCNACGKGFNSLTLHANLCKVDNKKAYADLWTRYKKLPSDLKVKIDTVKYSAPEINVMPLEMRDKIYRLFLNSLSLSDAHIASLKKRGLSEDRIKLLMYRDCPTTEMDLNFIKDDMDVKTYISKHPKRGIAGLYDLQDAPKCVARKSGILIPVIVKRPIRTTKDATSYENLISGLQIRFDEGDKRYSYYTSLEKEGGCGFTGCESIHMNLPDSLFDTDTMSFVQPECKKVVLTEGCLKADVASYLTGVDFPFIAVLGVSNQKYLAPTCKFLKETYQTNEIVLMFDEDYVDNRNVDNALKQAKEKIVASGLKVSEYHWSKEYKEKGIKGIDDLLLYQKQTQ